MSGNKRLALAAVIAFYGLNGRRLTLANDEAYDLVMSVAEGRLDTVDAIAACSASKLDAGSRWGPAAVRRLLSRRDPPRGYSWQGSGGDLRRSTAGSPRPATRG
jgi:hypothetical protein